MGALDKRIFSGVAMLSALLFVVSAILLLADGGDVNADSNDTALYILTVSGILAVVYSVVLMMDRSSFVRTLSGAVVAIAGIIYLAVPFAGGADTMIAVASIVAAVAMIADMLALWVSRVYGAMYVTAVLAALELITGVLHFINDPQASYYAIALLVFGVWLCLSAYVTGFVKTENATRTREVKEDKVAKKAERPQAKNTKATKKAKKPEKKEEPKETPKEEPKPEPKPAQQHEGSEERPKIKPVRTVELPKRNADVKPESKPEPRGQGGPQGGAQRDSQGGAQGSSACEVLQRLHEEAHDLAERQQGQAGQAGRGPQGGAEGGAQASRRGCRSPGSQG